MSTATLEFSSPTAVYKGLAEATGPNGPDLYATDFHDGTVDVFNSNFQKVTRATGCSLSVTRSYRRVSRHLGLRPSPITSRCGS
jgi:hypothetical protein